MNKKAQTWQKLTRLNEETLEKVIQSIFEEEFAKQEQIIGQLVSANLHITMEEIRTSKANERLKKGNNDLKENLQFTENVLEDKVKNPENKFEIEKEIKKR